VSSAPPLPLPVAAHISAPLRYATGCGECTMSSGSVYGWSDTYISSRKPVVNEARREGSCVSGWPLSQPMNLTNATVAGALPASTQNIITADTVCHQQCAVHSADPQHDVTVLPQY